MQVDARRDRPVAELIAEWETNGPQIDPLISSFGVIAGQFLGDAVTHEHDIRGALDAARRPRQRRARDRFRVARRTASARCATGPSAGALTVETEAGPYTFGSGPPTETCATSRFELRPCRPPAVAASSRSRRGTGTASLGPSCSSCRSSRRDLIR